MSHTRWLGDRLVICWCPEHCAGDPCLTREHWLDVEDSEFPEDAHVVGESDA